MAKQIKSDNPVGTTPAPPGKMTYEEFLEWLKGDVRTEWVNGEAILLSPNSSLHQRLARFLAAVLQFYVEARQLGEVMFAPFQMKIGEGFPGAPTVVRAQ